MFARIFRSFWPNMAVFLGGGENTGSSGALLTPTNSFLLFGVVTSVPLLAKIDQEMWRLQECRQTDTQNKQTL